MKRVKEDIFRLRLEGLSYRDIQKRLGCSKSTISYHLGQGQKQKTLARQRKNKTPVKRKVEDFCSSLIRNKKTYLPATFTWEDLVDRSGDDPRCYLTGRQLNLDDSSSFQLDHIQPRSRGGDNSLENCGIASKDANQCKRELTVEEFYLLCKDVVNNLKDQFE